MPMRRLVAFTASVAVAAACARPVTPDVIITNARVFTNDTARPWPTGTAPDGESPIAPGASAIAIKGERVIAVGSTARIVATAAASTRRIDAGGRVVVPGFNDARVDLSPGSPTPAALSALDRAAITRGTTSLQVVAGGPMRTLVAAAQQAERQARWRLIRSPMDGERPQDERPFLPPQPGVHLDANGVSWAMSHPFYREHDRPMPWPARADIEAERLRTAVTWAYGAEDPIILATTADPGLYVGALSTVGVPDVWRRKRPRLDLRNGLGPDEVLSRLGVVVTFISTAPVEVASDGVTVTTSDAEDTSWLIRLRRAGLPIALGSGRGRSVMSAIADAEASRPGADERRLVAVQAATLGSAYAEKTERDKGWLGPGALADLAILSDDVFTVPVDRLAAITSVLTMVGGAIVYDPLGLAAAPPR